MVNERQILMGLNKNTINAWDPCSLVATHLVEIQWQQTHDLRVFCWQERDYTYGGEPSLVCVLAISKNIKKLRPKPGLESDKKGHHWHHRCRIHDMCDIQTVESPRPDTKLGRKKGLAATQVFTLSYSWTPGGKMLELRWPGGGLFEEILSWDTSIIQRRSLYLWVASFVSILHGRATSSRAMKWWLAASLSSTSCVSTGFCQRQFQTKNIAFHFAQCNSIQFNLWNGIHFPWTNCTTSRKESFF